MGIFREIVLVGEKGHVTYFDQSCANYKMP